MAFHGGTLFILIGNLVGMFTFSDSVVMYANELLADPAAEEE